MFDHVLEKQLVLCHSLERLDQVGLKREAVANPLRYTGKELDPAFIHQPRLVRHVLEVHGVVEEILFEREEERAEFDGTLTTRLELGENYPAKFKTRVCINFIKS
jgi:hypothetical protein